MLFGKATMDTRSFIRTEPMSRSPLQVYSIEGIAGTPNDTQIIPQEKRKDLIYIAVIDFITMTHKIKVIKTGHSSRMFNKKYWQSGAHLILCNAEYTVGMI